jgi:hypothetical protein
VKDWPAWATERVDVQPYDPAWRQRGDQEPHRELSLFIKCRCATRWPSITLTKNRRQGLPSRSGAT